MPCRSATLSDGRSGPASTARRRKQTYALDVESAEPNPWDALNARYGRDGNAQFLLFVEQFAEIRPLLLADSVAKQRLALVAIDNLAEVVLVRHLQSIDLLIAGERRALGPRLTEKDREKFRSQFSYRVAIGKRVLRMGCSEACSCPCSTTSTPRSS
jgi:hypothetical protein